MKRLIFVFFLLTPCLANSKAVFSPNLQAQLDSLPAQAVVEAFLVVKNRAPIGLLKASMPTATRERLHTEVVAALKDKAASSQTELLTLLSNGKADGSVLDYKSYWIDNYIFVRTTKEKLSELAERFDVVEIYENPEIELVAPVEVFTAPSPATPNMVSGRAEKNLVGIGCRQVWKRGLTGKGRLVCTLDTGIDGEHGALRSRWRGLKPGVTHEEAWFDPVFNLETPHVYITNLNHGTHVMGIICGLDTTAGFVDTIGVAPEAEWISAAVVDNGAGGAGVLDALQWAADPDGNPNTVEDVPDVVNNSWAYRTTGAGNNMSCNPFFWQVIDNLEAAGVMAVFAAGNNGPGSRSMGNPADRGTSPFSSFAVANFDLDSVRTDPLNPDSVTAFFGHSNQSSSAGPTECGPDSLKPEITAPGTDILSSISGGQYGFLTGTSMAAPHIAGAVAILRQYNPNATVDTIKWVLANSAIDIDLPGPDTLSGYGLINLPRALALMPPNTGVHLYVKKDRVADHFGQPPYPNGEFDIYINLSNNGVDTARALYAILNPADAKTEVLEDSVFLGDLLPNDTASNAGKLFRIRLADGLLVGERFFFTLGVSGLSGFHQDLNLSYPVVSNLFKTIYNHQNGNLEFTVSNFGQYGFEAGGIEARSLPDLEEGLGFERKSEPKVTRTFEASFMAGINDSMVSNSASNEFCCLGQAPDADFAVHPGGNLLSFEPGLSGGAETFSIFDDRLAKYPIGLAIAQKSYSFDGPGEDNFALLEFTLLNQTTGSLTNLWAGLLIDLNFHTPTTGSFVGERVGFSRAFDLGYEFNNAIPAYRGIAAADTGKLSTFRAVRIFPTPPDPVALIDGFTLQEKWALLTSGLTDTAANVNTDAAMLAAKGPFSLAAGDSVKIAFALVAAKSLDSLKNYAQTARYHYLRISSSKGDLNGDRRFTPADIVLELNCVFLSEGACALSQTDLDCDGTASVTDAVILMNRIFLGIPPPCP